MAGSDSDDGCIGNQRVRTIVLSWVIIAFYAFGMAMFEEQYSFWKTVADTSSVVFPDADQYRDAWGLAFSGALIALFSALGVFIFNLCPICDGLLGKICGGILVVGGLMYMVGWFWYIVVYGDAWLDATGSHMESRIEAQCLSLYLPYSTLHSPYYALSAPQITILFVCISV